MRPRDELIERLAARRAERLGGLSEGARDELCRSVRNDPAAFVDDTDDKAFYQLVLALERHERAARAGELIDDDDAFYAARDKRLRRLIADCHAALAVDASCLDAALVAVLAADERPALTLEALIELRQRFGEVAKAGRQQRESEASACAHPWDAVRARGHLRLRAAIARTALEASHYRLALTTCDDLITRDPVDHVGARHTCALALARLEDEPAFDRLDQRFGRQGSAWLHLSRAILHYKLGHAAAARRALNGFVRLVGGGAYALLRPVMVDTYLPDRPNVEPASYPEATLVVWEAEPIIVDIPDFPNWAARQPGIVEAAQAFAERNDLDW